ncbi:MAG: CoB--CoM heterodisulfide reductase iron-sulfur subunit B family protein [Syntrophobacteraceae bacterium]|nr:CoB--CoM heterodisulfide reductase iron-sulfur subunit B family protein [Desulfobacteraceae bacterium]
MKTALFRCCVTSMDLGHYETSCDAVLRELGIEVAGVKEFGCCGYPLKNSNKRAYLLSSARNLALAEREDLALLTLCNCCYGSLKHAARTLRENPSLKGSINVSLEKEGLWYEGRVEPKHFLQVLHDDIGAEVVRNRLKRTFKGLRIAVHYGCHILRPSSVVQFDRAFQPTKFDVLVEATGARSVSWRGKLECCGSPLMGVNDELSMDLMEKKIAGALEAGADFICVACPYCQLQFDTVQEMAGRHRNRTRRVPSVLYQQLLGLCLGLDPGALGLDRNRLPLDAIERFYA